MDFNWFQGLILGLISGLTEILPVSAQAHRLILLRLFGMNSEPALLGLLIHLSTLAALHFCCRNHIIRMMRAQRMSKIPKRRRKRPLDTRSLMDYRLLCTTLIPTVLGFILYYKTRTIASNVIFVAGFLFINGLILYIPQYLPGSNKESGDLSPVDGVLMGIGAAASTLPGISCVGTAVSIGSVRGMDPKHALNTALIMNIPVTIGMVAYDLLAIVDGGLNGLSFGVVLGCLFAAAAAFVGVFLGIKALRKIAESIGYSVFGFYSWGAALFTFILFLTAA